MVRVAGYKLYFPFRLVIIGAVLMALLATVIVGVGRAIQPDLTYELAEFTCREDGEGAQIQIEDSCLVRIRIVNHEVLTQDIRYVDTGGGPFASPTFHIRMYDPSGKQCYAAPNRTGPVSIGANSSTIVEVRCIGPDNLDVDDNPAYVLFDFPFSKQRVDLR